MREDLLELFSKVEELGKYFTDEELAQHPGRSSEIELSGKPAGVARRRLKAAACATSTVDVNEGEVVLDVVHRLQAEQARDLARGGTASAGRRGSCSAEINGRRG